VPAEAKVGASEDEERANRMVRWLRRSGLHAQMKQVGEAFEVVVPSGREERQARSVLQALQRTRERTELSEPTGWNRVRGRLLNVESAGTVFAVVVGAVLLLVIGIWLWALAGMVG
jgi:hypothetical protein